MEKVEKVEKGGNMWKKIENTYKSGKFGNIRKMWKRRKNETKNITNVAKYLIIIKRQTNPANSEKDGKRWKRLKMVEKY